MKKTFRRPGLLALDVGAWGMPYGAPAAAQPFELVGDVAVVAICGPLTQHDEGWWWGCDNYDAITSRVRAALESPAKSIVLRIDSPGGDAQGAFECGRGLRAAATAAGKKLYAFTDSMAASAAYAIACSADGGVFASPSAQLGSVGVIMVAVDETELDRQLGLRFAVVTSGARKADGHPHVAFTDEARAAMQGHVNVYAEMFFGLVAEMRPALSIDAIRALEARICIGGQAVDAGLADAVMTFDSLLALASSGSSNPEPSGAKKEREEEDQMDLDEMIAKLRETAEGDGDDADKAKKMLKALDSEDKETKAEGEDEEGPKSTKTEDDGKSKDDDEDDGPASSAKGAAAAASTDLAATVQKLSAENAQLRHVTSEKERRDLIATRPGLAPELASVILKTNKHGAFVTPMSSVRAIIKAVPTPKKATPAADVKAKPTPAAGQGGNVLGGATRASKDADMLDEAFGLKSTKGSVERAGTQMVFRSMTADEARAHAASKQKKETV